MQLAAYKRKYKCVSQEMTECGIMYSSIREKAVDSSMWEKVRCENSKQREKVGCRNSRSFDDLTRMLGDGNAGRGDSRRWEKMGFVDNNTLHRWEKAGCLFSGRSEKVDV